MKYIYLLIMSLFFFSCTDSKINSPKSDEDLTRNMLMDAKIYAHSVETINIPLMVEYTLPIYIRMNGGKDVYTRSLENSAHPIDEIEFMKIEILPKSGIIKGDNNKYYSVVEQKIEQKLKEIETPVYSDINLVAESQDGGLNWKFGFLRRADTEHFYTFDLAEEINKHLDF